MNSSQKNTILPYSELKIQITELLLKAKQYVIKQVNSTIVETYRQIGKYIVEYEQKGVKKAEYGTKLLQRLSDDLTREFWKGFSEDNLELMRKIYLTFSISETLSRKSLSWSHLIFLSRIKDDTERNFYLIETEREHWSLRELKRQFNSSLYERLALSKDKKGVIKLAQEGQIVTTPHDIIKDPYFLEFLGFKEEYKYTENELEQAIIDHLEEFLLELWKWFTFVSRQKRFTANEKHFYIDLVFYHRFLKCFVLIDLKIWELTHQDVGQMQMYVNYYDREIKTDNENKTIWLILCKDKDEIILKYTLPERNQQIFAKEYKLYLPDKAELKQYLDQHLNIR